MTFEQRKEDEIPTKNIPEINPREIPEIPNLPQIPEIPGGNNLDEF